MVIVTSAIWGAGLLQEFQGHLILSRKRVFRVGGAQTKDMGPCKNDKKAVQASAMGKRHFNGGKGQARQATYRASLRFMDLIRRYGNT